MQDIRQFIEEERKFYKSIVAMHCKILDETVHFTSKGFDHLIHESNRKSRPVAEQRLKLECLRYVPRVLQRCKIEPTKRQTKRIIDGVVKVVYQYGLVHEVIPGKKIRVVVEKVERGKWRFLSVMPHDKQSKTQKRPRGRS